MPRFVRWEGRGQPLAKVVLNSNDDFIISCEEPSLQGRTDVWLSWRAARKVLNELNRRRNKLNAGKNGIRREKRRFKPVRLKDSRTRGRSPVRISA